MNILIIHPMIQIVAIILALYTVYLGFQRTRSLHLGKKDKFNRNRHAAVGTISLITLLGGLAGGLIITSRFVSDHRPWNRCMAKGQWFCFLFY